MHTTFDGGVKELCKIDNIGGSCTGEPNDLRYACDTEGGSSGSPVLARSTHKVVGLHHCGGGCGGNMGVRIDAILPEVYAIIYDADYIPPTLAPTTPFRCQQDDERIFEFTLKTDNYGGETSWRVTDSSGTVVVALTSGYNSNTEYVLKECLPEGLYTFTIYDDPIYKDGICCGYGRGWYTLDWNGQKIVYGGGQFGYETSHSFGETASPSPSLSPSTSVAPSEHPTGSDHPSTSVRPSYGPSTTPSESPSQSPSNSPSANPSSSPSDQPSTSPSTNPSESPTLSKNPTSSPSAGPSSSPTMSSSPTITVADTCDDDPQWLFRGKKTCKWVARSLRNRCNKRGKSGSTVMISRDACPVACDRCITPTPPPPNTCADDPQWLIQGTKTCKWVARAPRNRCNKLGKSGSTVMRSRDACPAACNICTPPAQIVDTCADDPLWLIQGTKTCDWVAGSPSIRCNKRGKIGSTWKSARFACPAACDRC
jgi:hypothetical protein